MVTTCRQTCVDSKHGVYSAVQRREGCCIAEVWQWWALGLGLTKLLSSWHWSYQQSGVFPENSAHSNGLYCWSNTLVTRWISVQFLDLVVLVGFCSAISQYPREPVNVRCRQLFKDKEMSCTPTCQPHMTCCFPPTQYLIPLVPV